ncbi:hypothetical protein [Aeoliella mucimassa]|uniref:Uncharacterized protein n=1 Tax=Aeoliella mucimassa TaxID=2527972 RepID=A0A518ALL7_9BACT|nr:hypothetical protein [Aeoliella mucimassa]QDU55622.1 hypothetical protein Pan181_18150 [Aeoliella mucimassa]
MFLRFLFWFCLALAIVGWLLRGVVGRWLWSRRLQLASEALINDWQQVESNFLTAAAATGKPRGLAWKSSQFHDSALLCRDRATGDIYALVGITVSFEAVLGGGMEDVAAVSNLRCATALLEWRSDQWTTAGRVLFNMEPREAVEHYPQHLEAITELSLPSAAN